MMSFSSSNSLPNSPTNMPPSDFTKRMTEILTKGLLSADKLKNLLINNNDGTTTTTTNAGESSRSKCEEQLAANIILASFKDGLALLDACSRDQSDKGSVGLVRRSRDSAGGEGSPNLTVKDGRGCHKRRRTCESRETISRRPIEDGHAWRKYGQKHIQGTNYPRSYYRCTHQPDQGCPAKKQLQKMSNEPERYRTIYIDHHTCTHSLQNTTGTMMMMTIEQEQECSHYDKDPIKEEEEEEEDPVVMITMDMKSMHSNSINLLATEPLYSSSSPSYTNNFSTIDRPTVSTGLKYAAGPEHGDASSVGCSGPTTPDSWEYCLDFASFMNVGDDQDPKVEDVLASLFPVSVNTEEGFRYMNGF